MDFREDFKDTRLCLDCKEKTMVRILPKENRQPLSFGIPVFEIKDLATRAASERPEAFFVMVYRCSRCKRISYFGNDLTEQVPK